LSAVTVGSTLHEQHHWPVARGQELDAAMWLCAPLLGSAGGGSAS
jgi:ribulose-5-phosphate 4-epimerase/fuculose-1-phosphate aldolase